MKRHIMVVAVAVFLASVCAMPVFAHCHGNRHAYHNYEYVCESACEDGYACGIDGHYCSDHRDSEACDGYVECQPARRSHHHGRH
ncbi:MAG: hypothetical protein HFG54_12200 [Lachnospiraceae bacterium]|jgi:hypothetical protein|nr:hypothetical protein [Lachnospiraceae bacterium]